MPYNHFWRRSHGKRSGVDGVEEFDGIDDVLVSWDGRLLIDEDIDIRDRLKRRSLVDISRSECERWKLAGGRDKLIVVVQQINR